MLSNYIALPQVHHVDVKYFIQVPNLEDER